jgi:hypothetical protein
MKLLAARLNHRRTSWKRVSVSPAATACADGHGLTPPKNSQSPKRQPTLVAPGVRSQRAREARIRSGSYPSRIRRFDVAFELGDTGVEVTLKADAAVLTTESGKIPTTFENEKFQEVPLIGDGLNRLPVRICGSEIGGFRFWICAADAGDRSASGRKFRWKGSLRIAPNVRLNPWMPLSALPSSRGGW